MSSRIKGVAIVLAAVFAAALLFWRLAGPTEILFVNFRDWQVAEYVDANASPFIRIRRSSVEDMDRYLKRADVVFIFGMGLRLSEEQQALLTREGLRGTKIHVQSSTSMENDLTTMSAEERERVQAYMGNGGFENMNSLFAYCRRVLHGRVLFSSEPAEPVVVPSDLFVHPGSTDWFATYEDFMKFYKNSGRYTEGGPTIMIITSNLGMRERVSQGPFSALVDALESRGMNAVVATGFRKRLENIRAVDPQAVLYFAHGRLAMGAPHEAVELLKELNIPLFSPLLVHELIESWEGDQQGMVGGMLGQSIVAPEMDGAIAPFVIGGLTLDERGYQVFSPIPERVERFASMVERYTNLRRTPNSEKRLAIVYLKGPGQSALAAQGLEVSASLLNTLRELKAQGYNTGPLPKTVKEFEARIQAEGPVLGAYARGSIEQLQKADIPNIHGDTLAAWMERTLHPSLVENVRARYGSSPGNYLARRDSLGDEWLTLPALRFGNIALLPQLMPALGDDEFALVHGVKQAPPYPYIATYLWAREEFGADAIMHFGTHGSLEFTPYKQSALSSLDWPDALVGDMPHFYYYTINNIGEAVIAKRRSYAQLISYITPPFRRGELYGNLYQLHQLFDQYETVTDGSLKEEIKRLILPIVLEENLHLDLSMEDLEESGLTEERFERIHTHLHVIESEKITEGLYTMGIPYTDEQAVATVVEMFADALAYARAELDGHNPSELQKNTHLYEKLYRNPARDAVESFAIGGLKTLRRESDPSYSMERSGSQLSGMEAMMAMAATELDDQEGATKLSDEHRQLLLSLLADEGHRGQLESFRDNSRFRRMTSLLDSSSLEGARSMSQRIPAMRDAVRFMDEPGVSDLVRAMRDPDFREQVLSSISDRELLVEAERESERRRLANLTRIGEERLRLLQVMVSPLAETGISTLDSLELRSAKRDISYLLEIPVSSLRNSSLHGDIARILRDGELRKMLESSFALMKNRVAEEEQRLQRRRDAAHAVANLERQIPQSLEALQRSGEFELAGLINALNGGFTPPSTGGDPIFNPNSIPTGRNLAGIDAETTPSQAAWNTGKLLADQMLQLELDRTGEYPRKVAFTLWGGEFIRDGGITVSQILWLLGVEPVRTSAGRVTDVRLIPSHELRRPRVDVVVQTSGQFRDIAASRLFLIDKAVELAASAPSDIYGNQVREGAVEAERVLLEKGFSPLEARELSTARIFGGVNGNYGTGIMGLVESGDRYESTDEIAAQYLKNMGALYTRSHWGDYREGVFEAGLARTDVIMQTRSSNGTGPLSLDHVYEFMGGLSAAAKKVTGTDPQGFFTDLRNRTNMRVVDAKEAIWTDARSTVLNPNYIAPLLEGGSSSAEVFAEVSRNMFGWNVTKESVIDEELWDAYHETIINDIHNLGIREFFEEVNPYALQEITAVMLETVRKGMWSPDPDVVKQLAELHVELVAEHDAGCTGFVCDNMALRESIAEQLTPEQREQYGNKISTVRERTSTNSENALTLRKEVEPERFFENAGPLLLGALAVIILLLIFPFVTRRKGMR